MANKKYKVLGLTVIKYVGKNISGHNCRFEYYPEEQERYIIHCRDEEGKRYYDIYLEETHDECYSGWCTASYGNMRIKSFYGFEPKIPWTHKVKNSFVISFDEDDDDIHNELFDYSVNAGDKYYPRGFVAVNMDLFEELSRAIAKRPVWIFKGYSGLGKSTLGYYLSKELKIFETDSVDELPEEITADVVIVGNRKTFDISDIKSRLFGDPEVIMVDFSK